MVYSLHVLSLFSHLVLSCLSFSLSLSPCDVVWWSWCVCVFVCLRVCVFVCCEVCVWCVVCVCVRVCGVCGCVCCGTLKNVEKPVRRFTNVPVYAGTTRTCFNMCAWCQYTPGHFERKHGRQGSSSVMLTKIYPRVVITETFGSFQFSSLRKYSEQLSPIPPIFRFT